MHRRRKCGRVARCQALTRKTCEVRIEVARRALSLERRLTAPWPWSAAPPVTVM